MDVSIINDYFMPAVVVLCLCIGYILRNWLPTDNKWIPTILFVVGIISGIVVGGITFDSVVSGAVSGLASVGLNQAFKQALGLNVRTDIELTEDEVIETGLDEEDAGTEEPVEETEADEQEA
jgi:hypothetical protein